MATPPGLEAIARRFRIDLGIEIILLRPQRVGWVLVFEVLDEPGAVEFSITKIAGERRKPAATQETARIAHRIFSRARRPSRTAAIRRE